MGEATPQTVSRFGRVGWLSILCVGSTHVARPIHVQGPNVTFIWMIT